VKPVYIIPALFMAPIWLVMIPGIPFDAMVFARVRRGCAHFLMFYLVAAPIVAGVGFVYAPSFASQPSSQVARLVTAEWHHRYAGPLRFIGGDETYALATTFYSPDHPSYLLGFDAKPFTELGRLSTPSDLTLTHGCARKTLRGREWRSSARWSGAGHRPNAARWSDRGDLKLLMK
jgi:hypothetical protein